MDSIGDFITKKELIESLEARIKYLEKLLLKEKKHKSYYKRKSELKKPETRTEKAIKMLKLKKGGVIDLTHKQIAKKCFLALCSVRTISSIMNTKNE